VANYIEMKAGLSNHSFIHIYSPSVDLNRYGISHIIYKKNT